MFGVKKPINLTFNNTSNEVDDQSNQSDNYHVSDDSKYIYYNENDNDDQFIAQFEIYIRPNNYPDKKILVIVKKDITFEELYHQIQENFKSISEFKTISKLQITNFTKMVAGERLKLPLSGPIDKYLKSGDILFCDILSEEHWMKTYFKLEVKSFRKVLQVEYKIQKRLNFRQIKFILLKAGISLFYDEMKNNNLDNTFNYYLKGILFNRKKKKAIKNEDGKEYKYEVFVNMHFEIFEELIHEQLKTNELKKTDENYFRFNEYSNLLFEELISSEKFLPELNTIKDISKEFLTSQYNDLNTNFVFYNPKNPEIFESFFMSTADNTSSAFDLNDLSEFQEASNFISEDMDFSMVGDYRLMSNTSFTSTDTQYKPDANMIIISTFLNLSDSQNNSLNILKNNLNIINKNNNNNSSMDLIVDDNKINISVQEELKISDNPLYDSLIQGAKKSNKSDLLPDDTDKKTESSQDMFSNKDDQNQNIFFLDDESSEKNNIKKKKRYKTFLPKSKKYRLLLQNYNKEENCCLDLYELFDQKTFLETLNQNYKIIYNKKLIERIKVPESRNLENVDRNFFKFLQKRDKKKRASCFKYYKTLIGFLIFAFLYFLFVIITVNIDFLNVHIS
jgi:hypothetical protein